MSLKNKIVVVTGGAGLVGSAFVEQICLHGGIAIIADIDKEKADIVKKTLCDKNGNLIIDTVKIDICNKQSILDTVDKLHDEYGRIDALVNNAYPRNSSYGKKFEDVAYEDFCENTNLHLGGYFLMCQSYCEYFLKQGFGNIVNISSIYGVVAPRFDVYEGTPMTMPVEYAVIKSALIHLTKYIACYYKGRNIRINSLSLGGIRDRQPESFTQAYKKYALNKGMLDKSDITGSLVFLLCDDSHYINGHNLVIDDGWSL